MEEETASNAKRIHLCVCGGIAAYKVADFASALGKVGHDVQVAMTPMAQNFVGALTFQAITGRPVFTSLKDPAQEGQIGHIEFAQSCDLMVIAPATANILAKAALGLGDDPVATALIACDKPMLFLPAMNTQMWQNPAVMQHVNTLRSRGHLVINPDEGALACGAVGPGRLPRLERLLQAVNDALTQQSLPLSGQRILIAGGPTREYIDAVRFLSNPSSGKTAVALAAAAAEMGAQVTLVMGPSSQRAEHARIERYDVTSAAEMFDVVLEHVPGSSLVIMCAAVSDWTPSIRAIGKKKKTGASLTLDFVRTKDILETLGQHPARDTFTLVGYAAETENIVENAREKCVRKGADLVIANDVSDPTLGFGSDENRVVIVSPESERVLMLAHKHVLASAIFNHLISEQLI